MHRLNKRIAAAFLAFFITALMLTCRTPFATADVAASEPLDWDAPAAVVAFFHRLDAEKEFFPEIRGFERRQLAGLKTNADGEIVFKPMQRLMLGAARLGLVNDLSEADDSKNFTSQLLSLFTEQNLERSLAERRRSSSSLPGPLFLESGIRKTLWDELGLTPEQRSAYNLAADEFTTEEAIRTFGEAARIKEITGVAKNISTTKAVKCANGFLLLLSDKKHVSFAFIASWGVNFFALLEEASSEIVADKSAWKKFGDWINSNPQSAELLNNTNDFLEVSANVLTALGIIVLIAAPPAGAAILVAATAVGLAHAGTNLAVNASKGTSFGKSMGEFAFDVITSLPIAKPARLGRAVVGVAAKFISTKAPKIAKGIGTVVNATKSGTRKIEAAYIKKLREFTNLGPVKNTLGKMRDVGNKAVDGINSKIEKFNEGGRYLELLSKRGQQLVDSKFPLQDDVLETLQLKVIQRIAISSKQRVEIAKKILHTCIFGKIEKKVGTETSGKIGELAEEIVQGLFDKVRDRSKEDDETSAGAESSDANGDYGAGQSNKDGAGGRSFPRDKGDNAQSDGDYGAGQSNKDGTGGRSFPKDKGDNAQSDGDYGAGQSNKDGTGGRSFPEGDTATGKGDGKGDSKTDPSKTDGQSQKADASSSGNGVRWKGKGLKSSRNYQVSPPQNTTP